MFTEPTLSIADSLTQINDDKAVLLTTETPKNESDEFIELKVGTKTIKTLAS